MLASTMRGLRTTINTTLDDAHTHTADSTHTPQQRNSKHHSTRSSIVTQSGAIPRVVPWEEAEVRVFHRAPRIPRVVVVRAVEGPALRGRVRVRGEGPSVVVREGTERLVLNRGRGGPGGGPCGGPGGGRRGENDTQGEEERRGERPRT